MKKIIMALLLIASVFTAKAQIDPGFKTKCDNLLDAIEQWNLDCIQAQRPVDMYNIQLLTKIMGQDPNYSSQHDDYIAIAETERTAGLDYPCILNAGFSYLSCLLFCPNYNPCPCGAPCGECSPNGVPCSSCLPSYQNSLLNCLGLSF